MLERILKKKQQVDIKKYFADDYAHIMQLHMHIDAYREKHNKNFYKKCLYSKYNYLVVKGEKMQFGEDENFEDNSPEENPRERRIKQILLEENFKEAERKKHNIKKTNKKIDMPSKKRAFYYLGIFLITVTVICLILTEQIPWFYIKCNMVNNQNITLEGFYYKNFVNRNGGECIQINSLFEPVNGSYLLGLSTDDFVITSIISYYSFMILIFLGLCFTVFVILQRVFRYSSETMIIIQAFFSVAAAVVCVFLITIFIRFTAAHILFYHNADTISNIVRNANISFPVPVILIMLLSFVLKICFTIIKLSYKELEKKTEYDQIKGSKSTYSING